MALNVVWGRAHAPHARHLMGEITANARAGISRQILLVPEPFSHESERMLCELGGDGISLSCEVLTFTRLAHRVLAHAGGLADEYLDPAGRLLLLARALDAVRPSLTRWGRAAASPLFLERLLATIDELKAYQASPEMLNLSPKLNDLRLIWEAFDALAASVPSAEAVAADPRDLPSRVAEMLETCGFAEGTRLYIDGFVSFTAQERAILSAFIRRADGVTLCAPCEPPPETPDIADDSDIWEQPRREAAKLTRQAARAAVPVTHMALPCDDKTYHPVLRRVETYLMGDEFPGDLEPLPVPGGSTPPVILYQAADVFDECEWAAELACSWAENGLRFRDIVIAAPDWEVYGAALESACARRGLPLFTDSAPPLTGKAAARFITAALDGAVDGLSADNVISLLKTGLTPIERDSAFLLEDYLCVHGVRDRHWPDTAPWTAHPSGWGETAFSERDLEQLAAVNAARERLRGPLNKLRSAFRGGKEQPAREYARALYGFCESMELPARLAANCSGLEERGLTQQAAEGRRVWGVICQAFDSCALILGERPCSPDGFARLFRLCLTQYDVNIIPAALDCVQAGPYDRLRRREPRRLILLGASEPYMPRAAEAPGLLTDEERVLIESNGASLAPRAEERASRELLTLYRCFSLPTETLAVSRPLNVDGAQARASVFFERAERIAGVGGQACAGPSAPVSDAPRDMPGPEWLSDRSPLTGRYANMMFSRTGAGDRLSLSPSRVQTYQTCPFQYFTRYVLRARALPEPGPRPSGAGVLVHAVLRGMVEGVMARDQGGFRAVPRDTALGMADAAASAYIASLPGGELRSAREARLLENLRGAALAAAGAVFDELKQSDFTPLAAELEVSVPLGPDGGVTLRGVIDRLDGIRSGENYYLKVTDYKTGNVKFSLGDVWHGLNIQTLCYLFALGAWDGLPVTPAGVQIERLLSNVSTGDSRGISGIMLEGMTEHRGVKTATPEQMGFLRGHVERAVGTVCGNMRAGVVHARPARSAAGDPCEWCDCRQPCLFDSRREAARLLVSLSDKEFWRQLTIDS